MRDFDRRVRERLAGAGDVAYSAEPKLDGLAVSLAMRSGGLSRARRAATARRAKTSRTNLAHICARYRCACAARATRAILEVRGEVFMPLAGFERFNAEAQARGEKTLREPAQRRGRKPATARSAPHCAASARHFLLWRRRTSRAADCRARHSEVLAALRGWGLKTSPMSRVVQRRRRVPRVLP